MTMVCIKNFVDCCLQQKYSKTGLISVKLLTAYGAVLCGDGPFSLIEDMRDLKTERNFLQKKVDGERLSNGFFVTQKED